METTFSFGWLAAGLVCLILLGRLIAELIWRLASRGGAPLSRGVGILMGRQTFTARFAQRFPRTSDFIKARVSASQFTGLPLTLCVILGAYLIALGTHLAEGVIEREEVVRFDHHVNSALSVLRDPHFLDLFAGFTHLANLETLIAVTLVSAAFLWADRRSRFIPGLVLTVAGSQTLTYIGKYAIDRARPDFLTFASATTPSFPSGHATGAIAVYGFIAYAIARELPSRRLRFELGYWTGVLIALIAFSRAVLSVHFASDIAAGLLVGGFWLIAGFALTEVLRQRQMM
ncbi:MAG: phosphatase PAP2 family protein [Salinisphaera sp.]|jgi:membrane-associated phospholipid phosphatase|nr:phosphatase PAP2 family protein [Salinisphaera sp.]